MKKTRVLHYRITNARFGGLEKYAVTNWKYIDKEKFEFDFVTYDSSLKIYEDYGVTDERTKRVCRLLEDEQQFRKDMEILFSSGYDAVHLHTSLWTGTLLEELAMKHNIPKVIVHSHTSRVVMSDAAKRLAAEERHKIIRATIGPDFATDFWACSYPAAEWLFGDRIPRDKIKIIKNAIPVCDFLFNEQIRCEYRQKLGLENCFVIGNVANFSFPKNHQFLLNVFAEISKKKETARLLLIGEGELEDSIRQQMKMLGVEDKVLMLGTRSDVPQLLQAMDVFCLPSRFEGLPISVIEAQSAGLRCMISDAVTMECGLTENAVFLPLEIRKWVEALLEASEGYIRKDMNEEITAAGYNIEQQIKEIERLYLERG